MTKKNEYKITATRMPHGGWIDGTIGGYRFQAKIFDEGSEYGINGGRVSKLCVWDEELRAKKQGIWSATIVNFDRGWDIKPKTAAHKAILSALLEYLEAFPAEEE